MIRIWLVARLFFTVRTGNCGGHTNLSQLELEVCPSLFVLCAYIYANRTQRVKDPKVCHYRYLSDGFRHCVSQLA